MYIIFIYLFITYNIFGVLGISPNIKYWDPQWHRQIRQIRQDAGTSSAVREMANKVSRSLLAQRTLAAWPKNWPIRKRRDQNIAKKNRGLLLLWFSSSFFAAKIWRWPFWGIQSIIRISNIYWVSVQFNEPLSWHKGTARKFGALGSKQVKPGVEVGDMARYGKIQQ